ERLDRPRAAATAGAARGLTSMLARIAHELYWIGRYVSRAEQNARMLDGVFRINLQARRGLGGDEMPWEAVMAVMGAAPPTGNGTIDPSEAGARPQPNP